jgi:hypothetical protein
MEVDFRSRLLAFRGAGGEPHSYVSLLSVSPVKMQWRGQDSNGLEWRLIVRPERATSTCMFLFIKKHP